MPSTLYPLRAFVEEGRAAPLFKRYDQAAYFIGLHRAELVKSGALIPGTGGRPSFVTPQFMDVVEEILCRTARQDL